MRLDRYSQGDYSIGASKLKQILWYCLGSAAVQTIFTSSAMKCEVLRIFGAKIGTGVRIKPGAKVKFPWRLSIGDFSWIGEKVWIDNLAPVTIGSHTCVSQSVYLCTGSHDWTKVSFDLITSEITIGDHAWLAAQSAVAPGVTVGEGAVLGLGSVATGSLLPWSVYSGVPAKKITERTMKDSLAQSK